MSCPKRFPLIKIKLTKVCYSCELKWDIVHPGGKTSGELQCYFRLHDLIGRENTIINWGHAMRSSVAVSESIIPSVRLPPSTPTILAIFPRRWADSIPGTKFRESKVKVYGIKSKLYEWERIPVNWNKVRWIYKTPDSRYTWKRGCGESTGDSADFPSTLLSS